MAKKGKLLSALDAHKGRDYELERQKKLQKHGVKKKRKRGSKEDHVTEDLRDGQIQVSHEGEGPITAQALHSGLGQICDGIPAPKARTKLGNDETAKEVAKYSTSDNVSERDGEEAVDLEGDADVDGDIPFSDIESLASSEKADIVPFQRLTVNNTTALLSAHRSIALPTSLPFSAHQTLTTSQLVVITDVNDDLNRELAFYKQCLEGAEKGRQLLAVQSIPFSRPDDYFAEMVKNDEHMGKIKKRMVDDAARKKASIDAKRQRDLKKFGKQVQVAKEQERAKAKRATLDKIDLLKRKRKNADTGMTNEEDLFDVALDDAAKENRGAQPGNRAQNVSRGNKRQKKNERFGFGGKKRFAKSGDTVSSGDASGYSAKRMKTDRSKTKRPGRSRRAKNA